MRSPRGQSQGHQIYKINKQEKNGNRAVPGAQGKGHIRRPRLGQMMPRGHSRGTKTCKKPPVLARKGKKKVLEMSVPYFFLTLCSP